MSNLQPSVGSTATWHQARVPGDVLDLGVSVRQALGSLRYVQESSRPVLPRREGILLGTFVLVLHAALLFWLSQRPEPVLPEVPVLIPPMTIEFTSPAPPEPVVEPPPPEPIVEPPEPVIDELAAKPLPKPKPVKPKPVVKPLPKPEAKTVEPIPSPPKAEAPAAPAPVTQTPPSANAAYLRNPAPEYPSLALRRGWEGTVLLRIRVLANGKPSEVQIQRSSGRDVLDQAAVKAVQRWSFVPAKRAGVALDGWVTVPLDFRLN